MKEKQVIILSQGRSGSTLLMRMLSEVDGLYISGENFKCFDQLKKFYELMIQSIDNSQVNEFMHWSWKAPCSPNHLLQSMQDMVRNIYNPDGKYRYWGFKEIRYGFWNAENLEENLNFLRLLMPECHFLFSIRDPNTASKSSWWAYQQNAITDLVKCRKNFEYYTNRHPDCSFIIEYEHLYRGSDRIREMFEFLDIPFEEKFEGPLDVVLK